MSRLVTKPTKWHVRPAKTRISLGGCPDWSEFLLGAQVIALVLSWGGSNVSLGFISASVESINRTEAGTIDHYGLTAAVGSVTSNIKLRANQQEFRDGVGAYSLVTIGQENRDGNNWVTYTGILVYPPFCKQSVYPSCFFRQGTCSILLHTEMSHLVTKPTKWYVRPAKTQISLGVRPVWSVFAVRMKKAWVLTYLLSAQRRLWSDWADAQADLSLRWAHMQFCWFCHEAAKMFHF